MQYLTDLKSFRMHHFASNNTSYNKLIKNLPSSTYTCFNYKFSYPCHCIKWAGISELFQYLPEYEIIL